MAILTVSAWLWAVPPLMTLISLAVMQCMLMSSVHAPYGKFVGSPSEGSSLQPKVNRFLFLSASVSPKVGWRLMESPVLLSFLGWHIIYPDRFLSWSQQGLLYTAFLVLFCLHYVNRVVIYPCLIRGGKPMPLSIIFMGACVTSTFGFTLGWTLTCGPEYPSSWLFDPRFFLGVVVYLSGWVINLHSDHCLRNLRSPDDPPGKYKIPQGGLFEYVSGANYFGEIVEWFGWACLLWSSVGWSWAVLTVANLLPRALHTHQYYKSKFGSDYPSARKAVLPFLL
ncbi:3-oxo-5-alpha-steroid 4-dehydrogenase [Pelomyxa schiedti]|nr:3-oxo-5-alpha-steroid 4-dehydrogenase [Pelomyxa schiedti]